MIVKSLRIDEVFNSFIHSKLIIMLDARDTVINKADQICLHRVYSPVQETYKYRDLWAHIRMIPKPDFRSQGRLSPLG